MMNLVKATTYSFEKGLKVLGKGFSSVVKNILGAGSCGQAEFDRISPIFKVNDKDFSITLNAYFIVKWRDDRLIVMDRNRDGNATPILTLVSHKFCLNNPRQGCILAS